MESDKQNRDEDDDEEEATASDGAYDFHSLTNDH